MRRPVVFVLFTVLVTLSLARLHAQDDVQARMQEYNKALGVECTHCHLDQQWSLAYLPMFDVAFRMQKMVSDLNAGALKQYGGITCNTCHQGSTTPPKITQEQWERDAKRYEKAFNGDNSLALQMGDLLVLLTDGIVEAASSDCRVFGYDRAIATVRAHQNQPARAIVDALYREVQEFAAGQPQRDDITAVVVKVL